MSALPKYHKAQRIKRRPGQPTLYRPEFPRVALAMCKLGATDAQLARAFEVTSVTIWNWRRRHKEFADATKEGKAFFDEQVVRALAHRAVGYSYDQEELKVVNGVVERRWVRKHIPPDVGACQFWLKTGAPSNGQIARKPPGVSTP